MAERNREFEFVESDLQELGRRLVIPPPVGLVDAVMTRIGLEPVPVAPSWWQRLLAGGSSAGRWFRERWRIGTAVLVSSVLVLLLVTPAGAAVRQWLGFGAVVVVQEQAPAQPTAVDGTTSQVAGTELSMEQARSAVPFPVGVPTALGQPARVSVSDDARVLTMSWSAGAPAGEATIQLDQIGGAADPFFVKKYFSDIEFTLVHGREALWLTRPHPIVVLAPDGSELVASARQSGPVLLWQNSGVTLRLEGVADREQAVAIAESVTP